VSEGDSYGLPVGSGAGWTDDYEYGRPGWPPDVLSLAGEPRTATVLELGAGTGKLTRMLVPYFHRVLVLEPQEAMREWLVRLCPRAEVIDGIAEAVSLPDDSVDAVFVAEAFHKFDASASLREIARVLKPNGSLNLLWNVPAGPVEPPVDDVEEYLHRVLADLGLDEERLGHDPTDLNTARFSSGAWQEPFAGMPFGPLREARIIHRQHTDRDGLVSFYASMGWIGDMPDARRLALQKEVRSRLVAPSYSRPWETRAYWTRLTSGSA